MMLLIVTSFTLVWIKISAALVVVSNDDVTSFTLVWIKMSATLRAGITAASHELHARVD